MIMRLTLLIFCISIAAALSGQEAMVYVDSISLAGNKKTKDGIVLRELRFAQGDSIPTAALEQVMRESEELVMNTGLFVRANISLRQWEAESGKVHVHVEMEETWYIFPVPIFELADRNFNVWWVEQGRSLARTNYGIEFTHLNFTGQKDRFKLTAKSGYTRFYGLLYELPFINKAKTLGLSTRISYAQNREVNFKSAANKQLFYKAEDERFLYGRFDVQAGLSYRPGFHLFHHFYAAYRQYGVDRTVGQELNPDFFLEGSTLQRFFSLEYVFTYNRLDVNAYPLRGTHLEAQVVKNGLGIFSDRDALDVHLRYNRYFFFGERWGTSLNARAKYSVLRAQQPYYDNRAMGFSGNNIFGYEYYIIDGLDMVLVKNTIRYSFLNRVFRIGDWVPLTAFREMPLRALFTLNNGLGITNDPYRSSDNLLANRLLWGGGVGLDIIAYYNKVFRMEYSINQLGEHGLFLHFNMNI